MEVAIGTIIKPIDLKNLDLWQRLKNYERRNIKRYFCVVTSKEEVCQNFY